MQQYKDLEENLELEYLSTIEIKRNDNPYGDAYIETSHVDIFVNERGDHYDKKWIDVFYDEIT